MASTLEQRNYVATEHDIDRLADDMLTAKGHLDTVPRLYLRAVAATTIHGLGAPIRVRSGKVEKIDEAEQTRQLAELEKTIGLFHPRVVAKMSVNLPSKDRAKELNSRTNWARGCYRDLRNWIRAGHSLTTLAPGRLIKAAIVGVKTARSRPMSPGRIRTRVERSSKALMAGVMELAAADKAAAISEIQLLMGQLAGQLEEFGISATKDAKTAAAEHRPLRVGRATFFPTESQILRQAENPS